MPSMPTKTMRWSIWPRRWRNSAILPPVHFTTIVRRYFEQLAAIEDDEWQNGSLAGCIGPREHAQK